MNTRLACRLLQIVPPRGWTSRPGVHSYGFWRSTRCGELRRRHLDERACYELLTAAKRAYRAQALAVHPDHGGTGDAMVELTLAWKWLARRLIRQAAICRRREME